MNLKEILVLTKKTSNGKIEQNFIDSLIKAMFTNIDLYINELNILIPIYNNSKNSEELNILINEYINEN